MAESQLIATASLVPRSIQNLNALAERHGLSVRMCTDHYDDEEDKLFLFADWRGTESQLRSFPMIPRSWRLPLKKGRLIAPTEVWWGHPVLRGNVTVSKDGVLYEIDFGPVPLSVTHMGDVEVIGYADEIAHHGSADALIAAGIQRNRIPLGKRGVKSLRCNDKEPDFCTRRQPDGSYVHWAQTEAAFQHSRQKFEEEYKRYAQRDQNAIIALADAYRRQQSVPATAPRARPSYLRLVWSRPEPAKAGQ